jgi:hypothetical protein
MCTTAKENLKKLKKVGEVALLPGEVALLPGEVALLPEEVALLPGEVALSCNQSYWGARIVGGFEVESPPHCKPI